MNVPHTISKISIPDNVQSMLNDSISNPYSKEHVTCKICMKSISHKTWNDHIYRHADFKPFQCTCGHRYSHASSAKRHIQSALSALPCRFCGRLFKRKGKRDGHELSCERALRSIHQPEPAIHDNVLVSEHSHSVLHPGDTREPTVGADTKEHTAEALESMSSAPSPPAQIALLKKAKNVDGKYIDIPVSEPLSSQRLHNVLVEKQVLTDTPHAGIQRSLANDVPLRLRNQPSSSDKFGEEQQGGSLQQEDVEKGAFERNEDQNVDLHSNILHKAVRVLRALYLFLINCPFIALPHALDNIFHGERMDFYLSFLRRWVLGVDVCLLGGAWNFSGWGIVSHNQILQTFLRLSASFAFFGIIFGLLISYNIHMMKEKGLFVRWVNMHQSQRYRRNESQVSMWNPIIMLNLPLAWSGWSILNMILFMFLFGWIGDPFSGLSVAKKIPGASIGIVIGWSVLYLIMIQRELSKQVY